MQKLNIFFVKLLSIRSQILKTTILNFISLLIALRSISIQCIQESTYQLRINYPFIKREFSVLFDWISNEIMKYLIFKFNILLDTLIKSLTIKYLELFLYFLIDLGLLKPKLAELLRLFPFESLEFLITIYLLKLIQN